jgi:hypothetical protein
MLEGPLTTAEVLAVLLFCLALGAAALALYCLVSRRQHKD